MDNSIILEIIGSITTILTVVITGIFNKKGQDKQTELQKRFAAKQAILQMILEDEFNVEVLHKLPYNYSRILYEYDEYKKSGGNSDITEKMKEYEQWYSSLSIHQN